MDRDGSLAATTGPVAEPRALSQQTLPNMWNIAKCSTQYRSEKRNDSQPNMDARSAEKIPNIRLETDYIRISLSGVNQRAPSFHIYGHQQQQRSQQQIPIRYDQNGFRISGEIVGTDHDQSDNQRPAKLILELDGNVYHVDLARLQLDDENNQKRVERRNPKQQIDDTSCTFLPNDDDIVWLVSDDDDDDDDDDCDDIQILPTPKSSNQNWNQNQNQNTNSNQKGRPDSIIETNQMQRKESKQNSCSTKTMTTLNEKKSKNCSKINPNCLTNNNNNNDNIVVEESEDASFSPASTSASSASAVQICANRCKSFEQKIDACLERLNRNVENFDCSPETLQFVIDTLQSFTGLYEVYIRNDAARGGALFRPIYRSKVDQILHMCAEQFRLASEFANVERLQDSISIIVDETCRIVRRTLFDNVENDNEKLKITLDKIYKLIKSLLPFRLLSISNGAVRSTPSFQQAPKLLVDILQLLINPCPFARALLLTALLKLSRTMLSYGPDSVITDYHRRFFANDRGQKTSVDSEEEMDPRNIRLSAEKLILSHLRICVQELDRMAAAANDVKRRSSSPPIMEFLDRAQHYDEVYFEFVQIARLYYDHDRDNKCASTSKNRDHNSSDNYISEMKDITEKLHRHLAGGEHRHAPTPQFTRLIRPELEMLANLRKPCSFVRALLADAETSNGEEEKRKAALSAANIDKRTQDESRNNDDDNVKIEQSKSDQSKSSDKKRAKKDSKKCSKKKRNNEKRFKSKFADRLMWFLKMANEKHYMAKIFDKIDHKLSSLICRSGENESGLLREVSSIHRSGNKAIAENEISRSNNNNNNNNMKNKRKCESATTIESANSEANNNQRMIDDDDEILLVYDKRDDNADDDHHRKRKMQKKNNNLEQEIQQQRLTPEEEEIDQQELVERIEVLAVQDSLEEDRGGEISQKGNLKLITNKCDDATRTTRVHLRSEEERAKYQSQNSQPLTVRPVTTEIEKISENEETTKQSRKRVLSLHLDDEDDDEIQESYDIHQSTVDADILKAKKSKTTTNFEDNANKATKEFSPIELDASTHQESQNFENEDNIEIIMEIRKLQSDIHRFQTEIAAIMQQLQQNPD